MSKTKQAAKSVAILIVISFITKFLGFFREMLVAKNFGAGFDTDTYFVAGSAIALFTAMINSALSRTLIPILAEVEVKEGKAGKLRHVNNILNIMVLIAIATIIIACFASPIVIKIIAYGFEGKQFDLAVLLMRIGLPAILFSVINGVFRGFLQSESMFFESSIADLPKNIIFILFLLIFANKFGVVTLTGLSLVGALARIAVQYPSLRKIGYRHSFAIDFKDHYFINMIKLTPPVLISSTVYDINTIVDKSMASTLKTGSISVLNYGATLNSVLQNTILGSVNTVIYPMLSQAAHSEGYRELKKAIIKGLNILFLISIPAAIGMIALSNPLVRITFERGRFDQTASAMTMIVLILYTISLPATAIRSMIYLVYYALQDTKTPMYNSFVIVGTNILFNLLLIGPMKYAGLALASSIASFIATISVLVFLRKKIGPFGFYETVVCMGKALLAAVAMGIVIYTMDKIIYIGDTKWHEFAKLIITGGSGLLVYVGIVYAMGVVEVKWVFGLVMEKLGRK